MITKQQLHEIDAVLVDFALRTDLYPAKSEIVAADLVANILHSVTAKQGREKALDAVRLGIALFACKQAGNERFGTEAWVRIKVEFGDEVWHSQTGLGTTVIKEPS